MMMAAMIMPLVLTLMVPTLVFAKLDLQEMDSLVQVTYHCLIMFSSKLSVDLVNQIVDYFDRYPKVFMLNML